MGRHFVYDPINGQVDLELDDDGNVLVEYTREPDGRLISECRNGVHRQYHFDPMGNVLALTDDDGNVTDTFGYNFFGEVTERTGTTPTPYQFKGEYGLSRDSETGDYMAQGRPLSPGSGRFLSSQSPGKPLTLDLRQGPINAFVFAQNNPVRSTGIGTGLGEVGRAVVKTFAPRMKIVKASVSCCISGALDVNFLLPPEEEAPSGYIVQEIIVATQARDCDGQPVHVKNGSFHYWEAWSFENIRFRNMVEADDKFNWVADMRKTRGVHQVTGKLVGIIDYELPEDFKPNHIQLVPDRLELPGTYQKPPGWDSLPLTLHNMTLEWDCCCSNCCQMHTDPRWAIDGPQVGKDCPDQIPTWRD